MRTKDVLSITLAYYTLSSLILRWYNLDLAKCDEAATHNQLMLGSPWEGILNRSLQSPPLDRDLPGDLAPLSLQSTIQRQFSILLEEREEVSLYNLGNKYWTSWKWAWIWTAVWAPGTHGGLSQNIWPVQMVHRAKGNGVNPINTLLSSNYSFIYSSVSSAPSIQNFPATSSPAFLYPIN